MYRIRRRQDSHRRSRIAFALIAAAAGVFAAAQPASAVILSRTATRNTSTPSGTNAGSGWQWTGHWAGGFVGTPIASKYFLTAGHLGGSTGQNIFFGGKDHKTIAVYDDPVTDLRIYKIADTFNTYAPIYTGTSETNKKAIVIGRGTTRGAEVKKGTTVKGWKWGTQDKTRSWGENTVSSTLDGGSGLGQLLKFTFNRQGTTGALSNEAALSTGDSGGGVFINDGGKWKLAGINYLVDGPFSFTGANGTGFNASITDKGGLYVGGDNAWQFNADTTSDLPGNWYATRVSSRQSWIKSIIGSTAGATPSSLATAAGVTSVPEPTSLALIGIAATALMRRRRSR